MSRYQEPRDLNALGDEYVAWIGRINCGSGPYTFEEFYERPRDTRAAIKWRLRYWKHVDVLAAKYPGLPGIELDTTITTNTR